MELALLFLFGALAGAIFGGDSVDEDTVGRHDDDQDGDGISNAVENDGRITGSLLDDELFGWALDESESTDTSFPDDTLSGEGGDDKIYGGNGADTLWGGEGNDILIGGTDSDEITGGSGADTIVIAANEGQDIVRDFSLDDRIKFTGLPGAPTLIQAGDDARFDTGGGSNVLLLDVTTPELAVSGPNEDGDYFVSRITAPTTGAVISGASTGVVTEDTGTTLTTGGALAVAGLDGEATPFVAQSNVAGSYGTFNLVQDGTWAYVADNSQSAIQALNSGETLTDSFAVATVGGASQLVTVTLTGVTDPTGATIGGDVASTLIEDTGPVLTAAGTLTVTDPNQGEAVFVAQTGTAGSFGTFDLGTDGRWTYAADNALAAIQALNTGDTLSDSFTAATVDGTTQTINVMLTGLTDPVPAIIGGDTTGTVTEDAAATLTTTGVLTVTDPNPGEATLVAQAGVIGTFGTFNLATDGTWTYAADNTQATIQALNTGQTLTDSFAAATVDGTSRLVSVTIAGFTDPTSATIGGTVAGAVTEDTAATLTTAGVLTVTDPNPGEAAFVGQSGVAGTYGTFDLAANGNWTYAVDNSSNTIQRLDDGETITDIFTAATVDGTTQSLTFAINGSDDQTPDVELRTFAGGGSTSGFVVNGVTINDTTGTDVDIIGDVNGDGLDDLLVGAAFDGAEGTSFVVFGKADSADVELSAIEAGTGGFVINGASGGDANGFANARAGDVNGDGLDDILIGVSVADPNGSNSGAAYVIFGKADGAAVDLSAIETGTSSLGFVMNGVSAFDRAGNSVSGVGDLNGDGLDDILVGAQSDDPNGSNSGASFVVFGKADGTVIELSNVEAGTGGFVLTGVMPGDQLGSSVSNAGDVNGDGLDDLLIGARGDDTNGITDSGAAYVVFGKTNTTSVDLSAIETGTGGFVINGIPENFVRSGTSVSGAGDVNGDGLADLLVGSPSASANGPASGSTHVVFGKTDTTAVNLSDVSDGSGGFVILGASSGHSTGGAIGGAGDINGDGLDDIVIGSSYADPYNNDAGITYVVYGKADGDLVRLSNVGDGFGGFAVNGAAENDQSAVAVSGGGDINGDGFDDLATAAWFADPNGDYSGASYVVFGGNVTLDVDQVGTTGADILTGDTGNDVIFGEGGDDTIDGAGGTDRLSGGAGADTFVADNVAGSATILDFDPGANDMIDVSDFGFANFAEFQARLTGLDYQGNPVTGSELPVKTTQINLDGDTIVLLAGIKPSDITAALVTL